MEPIFIVCPSSMANIRTRYSEAWGHITSARRTASDPALQSLDAFGGASNPHRGAMMPRTEACRQPHVYSASLNSETRGIYFAATRFPADAGRKPGGDHRAPQPARRGDFTVEGGRHLQRHLSGQKRVH